MNILVLGDGLLGSEIVRQTNWNYISRKKNQLDITSFEKFIKGKYDVIVNCIANTDTYSEDKDSHWNTNYVFVDKLVDYCNKKDIKLVHISTDYIYTNSKECSSETDVPIHDDNWYSYTKLLSDGLVQLRCKNYLIVRCSHKPKPFPYENAWVDQIGNFDYVDKISELIIKLIEKNSFGVFNLGTEIKSIYDLAKRTRQVTKSNSPVYVPKNITMNLNKLKENLI